MADTKKAKKDKNTGTSLVRMSRMDFEIARFVYEESIRLGLTDAENSFLLGKKDPYFFELLDPTDKNKFKTEQLDLLPAILNCTIRKITPNDIEPKEEVDIIGNKKVKQDDNSKTITYKFTVNFAHKESEDFVWKKKEGKGGRNKENKALTSYLLKLVDEGYFDKPKFGLTIYLLLQDEFESTFTVKDIQTSLGILCRKQNKEPVLERGEERSRFVYGLYGNY